MAQAVNLLTDAARGPSPKRLEGALAVGTVIGASANVKERVLVQGGDVLVARIKGSSVSGTVNLKLIPVLADGTPDDTVGTQATTGVQTSSALASDTEASVELTIKGERFVDVEIVTAGASGVTITYVDVFVRP